MYIQYSYNLQNNIKSNLTINEIFKSLSVKSKAKGSLF